MQCPVPSRLSATAKPKGIEVVTRYVPSDHEDPRKCLEDLFRVLKPLQSRTFHELERELLDFMNHYAVLILLLINN
jgi:hypothetical protein